MSMFGPKLGSWWVASKLDPRWDKSGVGKGFVISGGPKEALDWVEKCRKDYGDPPHDLEIGFMKF